jgi:hypothetical protein
MVICLFIRSTIALNLDSRNGKQCRERYRNHLDPNVKRSKWSKEEDALIISLHKEHGKRWIKFMEYLPGRCGNAIKNRFHLISNSLYQSHGLLQELPSLLTNALPLFMTLCSSARYVGARTLPTSVSNFSFSEEMMSALENDANHDADHQCSFDDAFASGCGDGGLIDYVDLSLDLSLDPKINSSRTSVSTTGQLSREVLCFPW